MNTIVQGSNVPIVIRAYGAKFDSIYDFEASLFAKDGKLLKSWDERNIKKNNTSLILPLEEFETITFPAGVATFELKWVDNGIIEFAPIKQIKIEERINQHQFSIPCATNAERLVIDILDSFSAK